MCAADVGFQLVEKGLSVRSDNRRTLSPILGASRLANQTLFFQADEYVPHVDAIDPALNGNFCVAQSRRRRDDGKNSPLIWRYFPFVEFREEYRDVDLVQSTGQEAGSAPENSVFGRLFHDYLFHNYNDRRYVGSNANAQSPFAINI